MNELYELLLAKAKDQIKKETSLSADTHKLISTVLKVYHASRLERTCGESTSELPPVVTAE